MGFLKKLFGFGKKEEEKADDEIIDETTQTRNFKYLDDLIHSGVDEIILDIDIILSTGFLSKEESKYQKGIMLDVDDLVIDGNGHTIDAKGKTRIFCCTGKNITIKNIILKNGFAEKYDGGGAVYNDGGELTITGSTLNKNAGWYGGAVYNRKGGELTITDSILNENTAEYSGGAINNNKARLIITDSTLNKNTAKEGGSIQNYECKLIIVDSTLTGNTAQWHGGSIHNNGGELTITDSTFNENTAEYSGGAIYLTKHSKRYESNNCTFKDNKPDEVYEEEG